MQIGGVYALFCQEEGAYFCKSITVEVGGVLRYFSKLSGSGVDSTLPFSVVVCHANGQPASVT